MCVNMCFAQTIILFHSGVNFNRNFKSLIKANLKCIIPNNMVHEQEPRRQPKVLSHEESEALRIKSIDAIDRLSSDPSAGEEIFKWAAEQYIQNIFTDSATDVIVHSTLATFLMFSKPHIVPGLIEDKQKKLSEMKLALEGKKDYQVSYRIILEDQIEEITKRS